MHYGFGQGIRLLVLLLLFPLVKRLQRFQMICQHRRQLMCRHKLVQRRKRMRGVPAPLIFLGIHMIPLPAFPIHAIDMDDVDPFNDGRSQG